MLNRYGYDERNDRAMNSDLSARLRSFFGGTEWWRVVEALKAAEVPPELLWTHVTAGIEGLSDEDLLFAMSVNWGISREVFDDNDVETEKYDGAWWYADLNPATNADHIGASMSVRGPLTLKRSYDDAIATNQAESFVDEIMKGPHLVRKRSGRPIDNGRIVTGQVYLK